MSDDRTSAWSDEEERAWKSDLNALFQETLHAQLAHENDPLFVGDRLGDVLRSAEQAVAERVIPRAVRKWVSSENLSRWQELLLTPDVVAELRAIGTSVANTMRPLAGNTFAMWIAEILNRAFVSRAVPMRCESSGRLKRDLSKRLVVGKEDYKPDIDPIVVTNQTPLANLSAKTTLAERVMQTINWNRYRERLPDELRNIRLFLVTAWETFEPGSVNRERVQELDGVYVCNAQVALYENIKRFSTTVDDLEALMRGD